MFVNGDVYMKDKVWFKFKIGKHKIKIWRGKWWDVIHGLLSVYFGFMLISFIILITGFENEWFLKIFWFLFSLIIFIKTANYWYKMTRRKWIR